MSIYCLVMNLVVFDIGLVFCLLFLLLEFFVGNWMMGEVMCKFFKFSVVLFNFVMINILVVIGCDCFCVVVYFFVLCLLILEICLIVLILWLIVFVFFLFLYGVMIVRNFLDDFNSFFCVDVFFDNIEIDMFY